MITVYTKPNCSHCDNAKNYLQNNNIIFEIIDVSENDAALNFLKEQGHRTVPQLYVGKKLLIDGGNSALQKCTPQQIIEMSSQIIN